MTKKNTLLFKWYKVAGANSYKIDLHQYIKGSKDLETINVLSVRTDKLFYRLNDLKKLDIGPFFWTIKANYIDPTGEIICTSNKATNHFSIMLDLMDYNIEIVSPDVQ